MSRKTMLIGIAAVALGIAWAVSSAQAGSDQSEERGGFKSGPPSQWMGSPPAGGAFASAPLTTKQVVARGRRRTSAISIAAARGTVEQPHLIAHPSNGGR